MLLADGAAHGYAIIRALREHSGGEFDLPEGSVYPALHRMERSGLIKSSWSQASGRPRRIYAITGRGRARLDRERRDWRRFVSAAEAVFGLTPRGSAASG